jgi:hypothetical protein
MDPNATLRALRAALDVAEGDFDAEEFRYLFDVLDEWLSKGGALPIAWEKARRVV